MRNAESLLRLKPAARRTLYAIVGALVASGFGWLAAHYTPNVDDLRRLAIEAWALKLHGAFAFAMLIALGAMLAHHGRRGWLAARNRTSGSTIVTLFAVLIVTGYALYYVVTDATRPAVSIAHWIGGIALVPMLIAHVAFGRSAAEREDVRPRRIKRKAAPHPSAR